MHNRICWNQRMLICADSDRDMVFRVPIVVPNDNTTDTNALSKALSDALAVSLNDAVWKGGKPYVADVIVDNDRKAATVRVMCF